MCNLIWKPYVIDNHNSKFKQNIFNISIKTGFQTKNLWIENNNFDSWYCQIDAKLFLVRKTGRAQEAGHAPPTPLMEKRYTLAVFFPHCNLKELGSKPCFHWLPTSSSPTKLFLFKIFSTCRAIWIKGLTDFETLAEEWWNAYPTYLQESRYVCVYM